MMVKKVSFDRMQLKHSNYSSGIHVYRSMETVPEKPETVIPESVISLLYRIYCEKITAEQTSSEPEVSADKEGG